MDLQRKSLTDLPVLIDCDGVIANFDKMFLGVIKNEFGIDFNFDDAEDWDYFDHPQVKAIKNDVWQHLLHTPGLIYGIEKLDYADEMLAKLREFSHVECVTSIVSGGTYADERITWLIDKAGFERYDIHLSYKKYRIEGFALIDDKPDNVIRWEKRWGGLGVPVLWTTPGRRKYDLDPNTCNADNIIQTGDVDELIRYLNR